MHLITRYIDCDGLIKNAFFKIEHNIRSDAQLSIFERDVLKQVNDSLILMRGISTEVPLTYTHNHLTTLEYDIDLGTGEFTYLLLPEPAFGSARECIGQNLSKMIQIACYNVQNYFESITVALTPVQYKQDSMYLLMNEVRHDGIKPNLYELKFEYTQEWSATCSDCKNGMNYLINELEKLSGFLYINPLNVDINYTGKIISDLAVYDSDKLNEQINILLRNALDIARVKTFTLDKLENGIA